MSVSDILLIAAAIAIFVFFIRYERALKEKRKNGEVKNSRLAMIIGYAAGIPVLPAAVLFLLGKWAWGRMTPI